MVDKGGGLQQMVQQNVIQGIFKLHSTNQLFDLKVTIGQKTFECHRLILASVSGYFKSLTRWSWRESITGAVHIKHEDITPESFQILLDILYKKQYSITTDTVYDVLEMSLYLQVKFLEKHCVEYLRANLIPDISMDTWILAEQHQFIELAHKASAMALCQIEQVVQSDMILHLPKGMLLVILSNQKKLGMDDVLKTILRWVDKDINDRLTHLGELLPFVSFPQLSIAYINGLKEYLFDNPFSRHLSERIREATDFNLPNQTPEVKRKIIARQDRVITSPLIRKCVVVVGGYDDLSFPS